MDKINEAKKSELIRKENALDKLATELANKRTILNSDTKEFNKIIDTSTKTLKKEQDKFSAEHRAKTKALAEEQKRLDIRARTITKFKEDHKISCEKFEKGFNDNFRVQGELEGKLKGLDSTKDTLTNWRDELSEKNDNLIAVGKALNVREITIGRAEDSISKIKSVNNAEFNRLQTLETKLEDDRAGLTLLKSKCSQDAIVNKNTESELQRINTTLESRKSTLKRVQKSTEQDQATLVRKMQDLVIREEKIRAKSQEVTEKIKELYELQADIEGKIFVLDGTKVALKKGESEVSKAQEVIKAEKANIIKEKNGLNKRTEALDSRELDLKDLQKMLGIQERDLKKKKAVLLKMRTANKGGSKL